MDMTKQQKLRGRGGKVGYHESRNKHLENSWATCPGVLSGTPHTLVASFVLCFVVPGFKLKALPMQGEASAVPLYQPLIVVLDLQV